MLYLSRLILDPRNRRVQRDLADRYQLHRTVMSAFPDPLPTDERVLFRLEFQESGGRPALLVQSRGEPDWSALPGGYLLPPDPFELPENPAVKAFKLPLQPGQRLHFRLRANPTVKRVGQRHGLYREEDQIAWLQRKGEQSGFRPLRIQISSDSKVRGWAGKESRRPLTLLVVQYDGLLEVTDGEKLHEALAGGIGPGKGFGCGLLSLAPT